MLPSVPGVLDEDGRVVAITIAKRFGVPVTGDRFDRQSIGEFVFADEGNPEGFKLGIGGIDALFAIEIVGHPLGVEAARIVKRAWWRYTWRADEGTVVEACELGRLIHLDNVEWR